MAIDDTHIVLDLRSLIWGFGERCPIGRGFTPRPVIVFLSATASNDIYVDLQPVSCNLKEGLFDRPVWRLGGCGGRG